MAGPSPGHDPANPPLDNPRQQYFCAEPQKVATELLVSRSAPRGRARGPGITLIHRSGPMPYQPIEDYGVIGNLRTAALSRQERLHRLVLFSSLRFA